jgi:SAM domain (Sterile alpha motif)
MAASEAEYDRLLKKPPLTWSVSEVGQWLNFINLEEYKISFLENSISGAELRELNTEDLVSLGVARLGHR